MLIQWNGKLWNLLYSLNRQTTAKGMTFALCVRSNVFRQSITVLIVTMNLYRSNGQTITRFAHVVGHSQILLEANLRNLKWFNGLSKRDFENGAVLDEIAEVFKFAEAKVEQRADNSASAPCPSFEMFNECCLTKKRMCGHNPCVIEWHSAR